MDEAKEFRSVVIKILIFGIILMGVFQLRIIEIKSDMAEKVQDHYYLMGQLDIQEQAINNGFAIMESGAFNWQTNIFRNYDKAIELAFMAQDRTAEINGICINVLGMMNHLYLDCPEKYGIADIEIVEEIK